MEKHNWWPTTVYTGHIDIDPVVESDFIKWLEVERLITDSDSPGTTTYNGYQRVFRPDDKVPKWYESIFKQLEPIRAELSPEKIRAVWCISYENGGFQDPHIHSSSTNTLILNVTGTGNILLHDPRPAAVALRESWGQNVTLSKGDYLVFPGWLTHNSRPSDGPRNIIVFDFVE